MKKSCLIGAVPGLAALYGVKPFWVRDQTPRVHAKDDGLALTPPMG